jgi:hypothetical protein
VSLSIERWVTMYIALPMTDDTSSPVQNDNRVTENASRSTADMTKLLDAWPGIQAGSATFISRNLRNLDDQRT